MSNDFTRYPFGDKTIRVRYDAGKDIFWFVVVDAMAMVFANPEAFWTKQKKEFSTSNKNSSAYYTTVNTDKGAVDVADLNQIKAILKTISNRKAKKEKLWFWVNNPIPQKITDMVSLALSDGVMTDTERTNIIVKGKTLGINPDFLNKYIDAKRSKYLNDKAKQSFKQNRDIYTNESFEFTQKNRDIYTKESFEFAQKKEREPKLWGCLVFLIIFCAVLTFVVVEFTMSKGLTAVLVTILFFSYSMLFSFLPISETETDNKFNRIFFRQGYYSKVTHKNTNTPIPNRIKEKIADAIEENKMTFENKESIIKETVNLGVLKKVTERYINHSLKVKIRTYQTNDLTRCPDCREIILKDTKQCPFCGLNLIWHKINSLTNLALSDRVLTDLERNTIINTAIQNGISRNEIELFLSTSLKERLKSYTKVDLRDCPYCGAQIPLVSDECLYCGKPLEHIEGKIPAAFKISGSEAEIIRSENLRIEEERHGIKECPDCGAPFPLISNICESCGHVLHERNETNIKNLLNNIMRSINRINDAPKPKAYQIIDYWFYYIILILSVFAFIVGIIADSDVGKFISLAGFIASIIAMGTNTILSDTKSPVWIADGEYYKARHAYEMYAREVDTLYGDDNEAQTLLSHFSTALKRLKRERYQNRIKVIRIILISTLAIMGVITYFSTKDDNNTEPAPKNCEEITMPPNTEWILNFSKELKPYPPESGVPDDMSRYLIANKGAELSFVLKQGYTQPVYRWKVSQLELLPGEFTDTEHFYLLGIHLLDSNYRHIATLGECEFSPNLPNKNYNTVIKSGKGHFYIDCWSKHSTSDERILQTIAKKAAYYTIYYTKR